ncbi:MAG: TetR/AcrR family transcriptional regulator [Hyphomicrobiaceae bacterium]
MSESKPRSNTAQEILDVAELLIQTRGYNAFSYQDIAVKLDIRKASIHYHFPTKTDLGAAVVERYARQHEALLGDLLLDDGICAMRLFDYYTEPYAAFAETPDRVCLCGALTGEFHALPVEMQQRVARFCEAHQTWLAAMLERGLTRGAFDFTMSTTRMAAMIFSALQGALLVRRATGRVDHLKDVILVIKAQLAAG